MEIIIGSDHAGFELKEKCKAYLENKLGIKVKDIGVYDTKSSDYPDIAHRLAKKIASGAYERGILICGTGIGMSMVANRYRGVRAALCHDIYTARYSRLHNDANVLVIGSRVTGDGLAFEMIKTFLETPFEGGRHKRRVEKIDGIEKGLKEIDPEIYEAILGEIRREKENLLMIASENYASRAVIEAQANVMTNKYAEGYPGARYYGGCEYVDVVERLAIERAKKLFNADYVNVQPHSGSQANMAVYFSVLKPGDLIMGMDLTHGGHLSHGSKASFSGTLFRSIFYGVNPKTGRIDFDQVRRLAKEYRPKMIIAGASAYPREIDFSKFKEIAKEVGAFFMADIAHIAGLIVAGIHPTPVGIAEFVTSTTHKTLRGPRGGIIIADQKYAKAINRAIFPGIQGGPLMHIIAAKAVAFEEALKPEFKQYQQQVVKNAKALAEELLRLGFDLVSGGTDNHLILMDLTRKGITGKKAEEALGKAGIVVNKNSIPFDKRGPKITSGIRLGTPALTTRGFTEDEMRIVARLIKQVLDNPDSEEVINKVKGAVIELCQNFPIYSYF